MSDCAQIEIESLSLVVEIPLGPTTIIEINDEVAVVEIEACPNQLIEVEKVGFISEVIQQNNLIVEIDRPTVILEFPATVVINNPDVPPGDDVTAVVCTFECGEAINVNRTVAIAADGRIVHADKDDPDTPYDVVGVSRQSGATGQFVEVVKFGRLAGASFGTPSENFFLGNNGVIQSSVSATGTWLIVGVQLSASEFFVNIGEPIRRS